MNEKGFREITLKLPIGLCERIKQLANECDPPITQSKAAEHLFMLGDMTFQEQRVLLKSADEEREILKELEQEEAAEKETPVDDDDGSDKEGLH